MSDPVCSGIEIVKHVSVDTRMYSECKTWILGKGKFKSLYQSPRSRVFRFQLILPAIKTTLESLLVSELNHLFHKKNVHCYPVDRLKPGMQ